MHLNVTRVIDFKEIQATATQENPKQQTHQPTKETWVGLSGSIVRIRYYMSSHALSERSIIWLFFERDSCKGSWLRRGSCLKAWKQCVEKVSPNTTNPPKKRTKTKQTNKPNRGAGETHKEPKELVCIWTSYICYLSQSITLVLLSPSKLR